MGLARVWVPSARTLGFSFLLLAAIGFMGCPRPNGNFSFTSADIGGDSTGRGSDVFDGAGAPAEDDGGAEGEAAREVVEPDVIRKVGDLLYVLNQFRGLTIVDLTDETIVSRVPTFGFPRDLYLVGDRAYVLVGQAQNMAVLADGSLEIEVSSRLYVVNLEDPADPEIEAQFDVDGDLVDSRLVGDVLYTVTNEYYYYGYDVAPGDDGMVGGGEPEPDDPDNSGGGEPGDPGMGDDPATGEPGKPDGSDGVDSGMSAEKQESTSYVTSVLLADPSDIHVADELEFSGAGQVIQVSPTHVFVAAPDYFADETNITVVDISDPAGQMSIAGNVAVPGYVSDRFKLDEWNGTLRVVSNARSFSSEVFVSTIDLATLTTLNSLRLEDASGDTLFATRFDGPLAYIVTYFLIDPLFVVDLSDPANPAVREPLEVPGFSTHIEPLGDRLIALGVDDSEGTRRVAVSLFDVSGDPVRLDNVTFGDDWSWSNAFNDVKAFTVLDDTIIVPFSGWSGDAGGYERLQFISYTRDSLDVRGSVDLNGTILRSLEHDGRYYGVTTEQVARIEGPSLDDLSVTSTATLAENVVDALEIDEERYAEIIARYNDGLTEVRVYENESGESSSVTVDVGSYADAFVYGTELVLIGTDYENVGMYRVTAISTDDESVAIRGETTVEIDPFFGGYYYGGPFIDRGGAEPAGDALFAPYPLPYGQGNTAFLLGDHLVLRGFKAETDVTLGGGDATQVLGIVDLESVGWTRTVGLGFDRLASLDQAGDLLYVSTKEDAADTNGQPNCAHYIQSLDPIAETTGTPANVPGIFLRYDASNDVLTLQDFQWEESGNVETSLQTVSWDGATNVTPIDRIDLDATAGTPVVTNGHVFYPVYDEAFGIQDVVASANGTLDLGDVAEVTGFYGQLLGAIDDSVYVTIGGQTIAHYEFTPQAELAETVQVMGYPQRLRFGESTVYAPMGYFGVVTLSR